MGAALITGHTMIPGAPTERIGHEHTKPLVIPPPGAPPSYQMQEHVQPPSWPELIDLGMRSGLNAARQLMAESHQEPSRPPRNGVAALALVLSIVANLGLLSAVLIHQFGNGGVQAELAAQREAIYLLIDVLCESNPKVCTIERKLQR